MTDRFYPNQNNYIAELNAMDADAAALAEASAASAAAAAASAATAQAAVAYNMVVSPQPANAYSLYRVPLNGMTYVDNAFSIRNDSVNSLGKHGNAAIRLLDYNGHERGAVGYSSTAPANYYVNTVYVEGGNIVGGTDTDDSCIRLIMTFPAGSTRYPGGNSYFAFEAAVNGDVILTTAPGTQAFCRLKGNVSIGDIGTQRLLMMAGSSTYLRLRERGTDQFAITVNVDTGTTQDNVTKPSWIASIGAGDDRLVVSRAAAGSTTYTDLITQTGTRMTLSQNVTVGAIASPKEISLGMSATSARIRQGDVNDELRISTNLNASNVQDNTSMSSWRIAMGYSTALDTFKIGRIAAGGSTITDLWRLDANGVTYRPGAKSVVTADNLTTATLSYGITVFTGTAGASFAATLPAASSGIDGAVLSVTSTTARASTTWVSSGGTVAGAPSTLAANVPVKLMYHHGTTSWYVIA